MTRRPMAFNWRPTGFFGRALAFALGLCLLVLMLVISIVAVSISLAAFGLYLAYWWWKRRSLPSGSRAPIVIDVTPEVVDERTKERSRNDRA